MAAVPVTITGVLFDKYARTSQLVTLMGEATITGLGVGGGPMPPQGPVDPSYGIPEGGKPTHPIYYPPHIWGPPDMPPGFWGGGLGPGVKPQPPIPPKPTEPPEDGVGKPPPPEGGWGYHPEYGWGYFPPSTEPSPKA